MRVLVACEYSGAVRDQFAALGHDAWSCDLLPSDVGGKHLQGDVSKFLGEGWDLMVAHPPCTYLASSGLHWNKRGRGEKKTQKALEFVRMLMAAPIPHICIENPIGRIGTAIRKADQYIQPYDFGDDASKNTGLWLKNLPVLRSTSYFPPRIVEKGEYTGKERWSNQTDSGQNRLGPSEDRWKERSRTYPGIAKAMADQWGRGGLAVKTPDGEQFVLTFEGRRRA
jgi:hypothetical protein